MTNRVRTDDLDRLQQPLTSLEGLTAPMQSLKAENRRVVRIRGVGRIDKESSTSSTIQISMPTEDVLVGLRKAGVPIVFVVRGTVHGISICWGVWSPDNKMLDSKQSLLDNQLEMLSSSLNGQYAGIRIEPAEAFDTTGLTCAGLVRGIPVAKPQSQEDAALPMDRLIRGMTGANWACVILAFPCCDALVSQCRNTILNEMRLVAGEIDNVKAPNPLADHYLELLDLQLMHYTVGQAVGTWRTAAYLLGDDSSYARLAGLWQGIFSGETSLPEPVRVYGDPTSNTEQQTLFTFIKNWSMPDSLASQPANVRYEHPFAFQTLLTSSQLASYVHLPQQESPGFAIRLYPTFDAEPNHVSHAKPLPVGRIIHNGNLTTTDFSIGADTVTRHLLITGTTGSGKSNTVQCVIRQLNRWGIPFLVIEPTKSEYRQLRFDPKLAETLKVFTLGDDEGSPFRMNPFEVIAGISIGTHIDLLRAVFTASFGMWTPLPQVLERCLHEIYKDRGWDVTTNTNHRIQNASDRIASFPTLSEFVEKVDTVVQELGYEERITSDIRAALVTRLNSLCVGSKGRMLNGNFASTSSILFDSPTILELESIGDDDDKAFVMGLILIQLAELRRVQGKSQSTRHILVIEEAHRLLANVSRQQNNLEANPRGKALETFVALLAEVRAYGQGIAIVDQSPSSLAIEVTRQTNTKIAHRVIEAIDRNVLATSMVMSDRQARYLAVLNVGEAIVFSAGEDSSLLVQIPLQTAETDPEISSSPDVKHHSHLTLISDKAIEWQPYSICKMNCSSIHVVMCDIAKHISEHKRFRSALSRLLISTMENAGALDRLWHDLVAVTAALCPRHLDVEHLMPCVLIHGSIWFADRRGRQNGWSFADTTAFSQSIAAMLRVKFDLVHSSDAVTAFQELSQQLHYRKSPPFPHCTRICRQAIPTCIYRHAVRDTIDSGHLAGLWKISEREDQGDSEHRRTATWNASLDAATEICEVPIEATTMGASLEEIALANDSTCRVALCYAQHMLWNDTTRIPHVTRLVMDKLMKESGYE